MVSIIAWALIIVHSIWIFAMVSVALDRNMSDDTEPGMIIGSLAVYFLHWYLFLYCPVL